MGSDRLNLTSCRADYSAAARKPNLAELWFYDWGQLLIDEVERLRGEPRNLEQLASEIADKFSPRVVPVCKGDGGYRPDHEEAFLKVMDVLKERLR